MGLKDKVSVVLESKKNAGQYIDEVRKLLPELQEFMTCVLEAQDSENNRLMEWLVGIVNDTVTGIENEDEVLLRDVLEYGWYILITDIMEEAESDNL